MVKQYNYNDIRDVIFEKVSDYCVTSALSNTREGIIFGIEDAAQAAKDLGMEVVSNVKDGMFVGANETIMMFRGTPKQTAIAEDVVIGYIAKASGVATAAHTAVKLAQGQVEIVCGSTKKLPQQIRIPLRHAIMSAGAKIRICEPPFIYLDKNYIRIFSSVRESLSAVRHLADHTLVVQLRNEFGDLSKETVEACENGANVLMIDTGCPSDITTVLDAVESCRLRNQVKVAFAGDVAIDDIPKLRGMGLDMICLGRAIADAPMMDLKFDVISVEKANAPSDLSMNLLEKSELWIEDILLKNADLNEVALRVANVLGLELKDVLVVDVRPNHITLDILRKTIDAKQIAGKEQAILQSLGEMEGLELNEQSFVHSNGVLGLIALPPESVEEVLQNTYEVACNVQQAVGKRVCVFPTGFEVQQGLIQDTNSPYIKKTLETLGYDVEIQEPLSDSISSISSALEEAASAGFGLIILTGGVGAEDKDCTVESVLQVDPQAVTPWLVKYQRGTGRHVKDGIRIAVGSVGSVVMVSLPGPNDEVRLAMSVLVEHLNTGLNKYNLANDIADALRKKIQKQWKH